MLWVAIRLGGNVASCYQTPRQKVKDYWLMHIAAPARSNVGILPALVPILKYLRLALALSPTILAVAYYGLIATDRYVSEAQFVVRTASKPVGTTGLGSILQMAGLSRAQDDAFSVQSFLGSSEVLRQLEDRLPIRTHYAVASADFLARYPSILYGPTNDEFHKYMGWYITTIYSSNTGITTLRVQAFEPVRARAIAATLLDLSEDFVNRMNQRIQQDSVRVYELEVKQAEERLVTAQIDITAFRNSELMIDPAGSSVVVTELIARLSAELAQAEAQLREVSMGMPDAPHLTSIRRRIDALKNQILEERRKISSGEGGLAQKLARYERLVLEREFSKQTLAGAVRALDTAGVEARKQQLYLERIVAPHEPDRSLAPERARMVASVAAANIIAILVLWLVLLGIRERTAENELS